MDLGEKVETIKVFIQHGGLVLGRGGGTHTVQGVRNVVWHFGDGIKSRPELLGRGELGG